jgi:hypothetical protein
MNYRSGSGIVPPPSPPVDFPLYGLDLSLAVLKNGDAYHFELGQPMHTPVLVASHAARTDGDPPPRQRQDWHPDQLRLMPQPGTSTAG